mmetsp:Transcript_4900/g.15219  ORF Transcript_4900/g.15219 Transcript_4900/m.15219 type:complete len:274 (-) Transcript_4900:232-1053(-)
MVVVAFPRALLLERLVRRALRLHRSRVLVERETAHRNSVTGGLERGHIGAKEGDGADDDGDVLHHRDDLEGDGGGVLDHRKDEQIDDKAHQPLRRVEQRARGHLWQADRQHAVELEREHAGGEGERAGRREAKQALEHVQLHPRHQLLHQHHLARLGRLGGEHGDKAGEHKRRLAVRRDGDADADHAKRRAERGSKRVHAKEHADEQRDHRRHALEHLDERDGDVQVGEVAKVERQRAKDADRQRAAKPKFARDLDSLRHHLEVHDRHVRAKR